MGKVSSKEISVYLGGVSGGLKKLINQRTRFDSWLKTVQLLINDSDALQQAITTPQGQTSLQHALKFAAATGLSLNPQEGKAAIISYGSKIQYQVMSKGMIELAQRSGKVAYLGADAVRENDKFSLIKTMKGDEYRHEIAITKRGECIGYYAALMTTDGQCYVHYMTTEQVVEHRNTYAASRNGPWVNSFEGMALKTVIKRLLRNVNLCPELSEAIGIDDQEEAYTVEQDTKYATAEVIKTQLTDGVTYEYEQDSAQAAEDVAEQSVVCAPDSSEGSDY